MIPLSLTSFFLASFCTLIIRQSLGETENCSLPPRGWNSYNSYSWIISEKKFIQNAQIVAQRLKIHGYEYAVVDFLWYRRKVKGASVDSSGFDVIDKWGRLVPDPHRWPSSKHGNGFTKVAEKVHNMGLKFGIHVMRGISTQAFNANTPILDVTTGKAYEENGRIWYAKDIGLKERPCAWMKTGFMSVNTKLGAGRAFLSSLYQQYADWGVDFVKHDCVFGMDMDLDEITYVSKVLGGFNQTILYSLSPGSGATPAMASAVSGLANMYRITGDDWDKWPDLITHFNVTRDFASANMIGGEGLRGKSWPDLDMLPLGRLSKAGANKGPYRKCNLTLDEQKIQVTLWSIAKSPIMFGGDMIKLDDTTFKLITNPTLLEINTYSSNNMQFRYISSNQSAWNITKPLAEKDAQTNGPDGPHLIRAWIATGRRGEIYVAIFNLNRHKSEVSMRIKDLEKAIPGKDFGSASCKCREEWSGKDYGVIKHSISTQIDIHGVALFVLNCTFS
ncbi:hypothetical protein CASFOL_006216 [Castilleja foliolosa]|uniref:Alpha-galactosidase n=1 Tax=Castilleja foliolosa TaxID=1961234 RepID=A0ABD3E5S4_9LAMI